MKSVMFKPSRISSPSLRIGKSAVGGTVYEEMEFHGFAGLNNKYSNVEIADNEASDLLNVEFDAVGAITKRKGYTKSTSLSTQIYSILNFYTNSMKRIVLSTGKSLIAYDPIGNTQTIITSTLHGNNLLFTSAMDSVHNVMYLLNGDTTDGLMSWDGSIFKTALSGAPNGKYMVYYKNHLYIAGDPNNPNRLYISDQGDPTTWPILNFIDIDDGVGGITGMSQLGDSIVIFKERGVFILKGSDPSNYVLVTTFSGEHGTISPYSIVRIPNGLMYLSHDGVYLFDGKKFELISDKIQGSVNNWNQSYIQNAVAFEYNHRYWLSVPDGSGQTVNNNTYVFSYLYGWWTKFGIPMQSVNVFESSTEYPTPYFSDTLGNLFQADTTDADNGNSIDAYLVTKNYDFGTPAHLKTFKQVFIFALAVTGNYSLNFSFIEDFGLQSKTIQLPLSYTQPSQWGVMKWGVNVWGGLGQIAHTSTNVSGQVRHLQFKIEGIGANAPFTLFGWVVRFKVKRRIQ